MNKIWIFNLHSCAKNKNMVKSILDTPKPSALKYLTGLQYTLDNLSKVEL